MSDLPREQFEKLKAACGEAQPGAVIHVHVHQTPDYQKDAGKIAKLLNRYFATRGQTLSHRLR
jgi:hypothetical protein